MNSDNKTNNEKYCVPENLPIGKYKENYFNKEFLESIIKFVIIILIIIILSPIITNNIISTYRDIKLTQNFILKAAQEFPETFPALASAGSNVGNFVSYESKKISNNATKNLAFMVNNIYNQNKLEEKKCFYVCETR